MLDSATLQAQKEALLEKRAMLERDLSSVGKKSEAVPGEYHVQWTEYGRSEDENASEIADYGNNLSVERNLQDQLKDVDASISRIDDGSYGLCVNCGNEISEQRLAARPESTLCVACSEALGR